MVLIAAEWRFSDESRWRYCYANICRLANENLWRFSREYSLFEQVTKEEFKAIAFFDHSVFEATDTVTQTMTSERERLWRIYDQQSSMGRKPGEVYMMTPIATSGHSLAHSSLAGEYARVIRHVEPQLDNLASRSSLFSMLPHAEVKAMKLSWHLNYLDLGLLDRTTSNFHVLRYGPT